MRIKDSTLIYGRHLNRGATIAAYKYLLRRICRSGPTLLQLLCDPAGDQGNISAKPA